MALRGEGSSHEKSPVDRSSVSYRPSNNNRRGRKTKTGCVTCRARRVKCDEVKPFCSKCVYSGRQCQGYRDIFVLEQPHQPRQTSTVSQRTPSPLLDAAHLQQGYSDQDKHFLDRYLSELAPLMPDVGAGYWEMLVPQLFHAQPVIGECLLTLSCAYALRKNGLATSSDYGISTLKIAQLQHYNRAIGHLKIERGTLIVEITLTCCLLFVCMESITGRRAEVLKHIRCGISMLKAYLGQVETSQQRLLQVPVALITAVAAQVGFFGLDSTEAIELEQSSTPPIASPKQPIAMPSSFATFDNIAEASGALSSITAASHHDGAAQNLLGHHAHDVIHSSLEAWYTACAPLLSHMNAQPRTSPLCVINERANIMLAHHVAVYIYFCTRHIEKATDWAIYTSNFADIVRLIEQVPAFRADSSFVPGVTTIWNDMGVSASLYFTALKCRDPRIRREAVRMMELIVGRRGLWITREHVRNAKSVL
jgi:hypothetical protein